MFGVWSPLTVSGSGTTQEAGQPDKTLANPRRRPSNNDVSIWTTFWLKFNHHRWLKKAPASPKLLQLFPHLPPNVRFIGCVWRSCISTNPSLWRTPKAGSLSISWFSRHPRIWAHSTAPSTPQASATHWCSLNQATTPWMRPAASHLCLGTDLV